MKVQVFNSLDLDGDIRVPSSKPHMQRALIFALLSKGETQILFPSWSTETMRLYEAILILGVQVICNEKDRLILRGTGGRFKHMEQVLRTEGSGFMFRTMAALASTQSDAMTIEGAKTIGRRPILQHLSFIRELGGTYEDISDPENTRLRVNGAKDFGGTTFVSTSQTSQFLTALLLVGPLAKSEGLCLKTADNKLVGEGYIDLTLEMMRQRGAVIEENENGYTIFGGEYEPLNTRIPSDFTALSYILAAVIVVPGSHLTVSNFRKSTMTCEKEFFEAFSRLGAKTEFDPKRGQLRIWHSAPDTDHIEINGINIPTVVPALCTAACFADAEVHLVGAEHVNHHKCQRLMVMIEQLKQMGCAIRPVFSSQGTMEGFIAPDRSVPEGGVSLQSFGDHRVLGALFAAALGAKAPIEIDGAENMPAGYPDFYEEISKLGANFSVDEDFQQFSEAS